MEDKALDKLSSNLITLLMDFNKSVFRHDELVKTFPIPPSHVKVIFYLTHNGPSSVSQVSKDLMISRPNMSPIIDRLIELEYITRYEDPNDRRVMILEAADKAKECFKMKSEIVKAHLSKKLSCLSDEDISRLNEISKEFSDIISKIDNK